MCDLACKVERYKDTHEGRLPKDDGVETMWVKVDGANTEVALVRKREKGEWDFEVQEASGMIDSTEIDNGAVVLSANQLDRKRDALASKVLGAKSLKTKTEADIRATALAKDLERKQVEEERQEQDTFGMPCGKSDSDDEQEDDVLGMLGLIVKQGTGGKPKAAPKSAAKAGGPSKSLSVALPRRSLPGGPPAHTVAAQQVQHSDQELAQRHS